LDVDAEKEIPSCELIATKCIGSGVTSEVYQGHWNRIGRVAWCRVGKRWEDVEPEELVGEGYIPSNAHPQQVVAIKMITDRSAFRKDEQLAFAREMKVLTQVQHENLVTFYGVCIDSPPLRIVTEFCEGGACFELLHNSDDVDLIWPQQIKMCSSVRVEPLANKIGIQVFNWYSSVAQHWKNMLINVSCSLIFGLLVLSFMRVP
ncbi:unnamed protein product, partial [Cladocopium goreaui]